MSSALVRQALEFVDQDESSGKKSKGKKRAKKSPGQAPHPYKPSPRLSEPRSHPTTEQTVTRLLALTKRTTDTANTAIVEKIVSRAQSGRPDLSIPVQQESAPESILFPDEPFRTFEKEPFCR